MDDFAYGPSEPHLSALREGWKRLDEASLKAAVDRHLKGRVFAIAIIAKDAVNLAAELTSGAPTPPSYDSTKPKEVLDEDKEIARLQLGLSKDAVRVVKYTDLFK